MGTLHRRSIALTQPQAEFLDAEAEKLGISVGELVRRIIDECRGAATQGRKPT